MVNIRIVQKQATPRPVSHGVTGSAAAHTAVVIAPIKLKHARPIAIVRHFSPSGYPTTVVECYHPTAILNAVESGWHADTVKIQAVDRD